MIYFNWFVIPVYSIIIILTMVAVLMDNRQPAKALAWLMVLAFVPVAGIILYFFFGQIGLALARIIFLFGKTAYRTIINPIAVRIIAWISLTSSADSVKTMAICGSNCVPAPSFIISIAFSKVKGSL